MRKLTILALLSVACIIGIVTAASKIFVSAKTPVEASELIKSKHLVDGAFHPEQIPDRKAYLMLFRLLSNRNTDIEKKSVRSYIEKMDLGDADALLTVAGDFERRVGELDRKAQQIHEQSGSNLDAQALAQLKELDRNKERIVDEIIASLPVRLGADGAQKCQQHINERVKRKMKYLE